MVTNSKLSAHESEPELKPCPFCGTVPRISDWPEREPEWAYDITCYQDACPVGPWVNGAHSKQVIESWNTRAGSQPPDEIRRQATEIVAAAWEEAAKTLAEGRSDDGRLTFTFSVTPFVDCVARALASSALKEDESVRCIHNVALEGTCAVCESLNVGQPVRLIADPNLEHTWDLVIRWRADRRLNDQRSSITAGDCRVLAERIANEFAVSSAPAQPETAPTMRCTSSCGDIGRDEDSDRHTHRRGCQFAPAQPVREWQPIETAPKDGRTILLGYFNAFGNWRTMRGQWMSEQVITETWDDPDDGEEGWYETSVELDEPPNCWRTYPTHWIPLPAPPAT